MIMKRKLKIKKKIIWFKTSTWIWKYPGEHILFTKHRDEGGILIVCLYVDDLIFTGNNLDMIHEF